MAARRQPRTLRDISHLFLSAGASPQRRAAGRAEAIIWIAAAGRSTNRARFASGIAAAFARLGMCASVCEIAGNLPNAGYYFGLEPADYLAAVIDRRTVVSGTWNGSVRFACSPASVLLARHAAGRQPPPLPHVIVGAVSVPAGFIDRACRALESAAGAFASRPPSASGGPDAVVVAAERRCIPLAREIAGELRGRYPAAILFVSAESGATRFPEADEHIVLPAALRAEAPRRTPPVDPVFDELAASLIQRLGSRRRREADAANE